MTTYDLTSLVAQVAAIQNTTVDDFEWIEIPSPRGDNDPNWVLFCQRSITQILSIMYVDNGSRYDGLQKWIREHAHDARATDEDKTE